jgi:hypothetical protein
VQVDDDDDERWVRSRDLVSHPGEDFVDVNHGSIARDVDEEDVLRELVEQLR